MQDENTYDLLKSISIDQATVVGDTRYDRVYDRVKEQNTNTLLENWIQPEDSVLVIGSSWREDEEILLPLLNVSSPFDKIIIAPHEVTPNHIDSLSSFITLPFQRYTTAETNKTIPTGVQVVLLDCIGVLADAYRYGNIAYVGGGFKTGLHNILEPATFGLPVVFGPNHEKFPEAKEFIDSGIGTAIRNSEELQAAFRSYTKNIDQLTPMVKGFIASKIGARELIMNWFLAKD